MPKTNSLKILFFAKSTPIYGGVERWLSDLVIGLNEAGHDCLVGLANGAKFHDCSAYHEAYPHLTIMPLDGMTGSPAGRQMSIMAVLKSFRPDIVVPVMLFDALHVAAYMKRKLSYKLVYPVHEVGAGIECDLSLYAKYIDSTVFVDRSSKNKYQPLLPKACHSRVISCGVRENFAKRISSSSLRIGFCGRLARQKRVLDLIPLCDELDKLKQQYTLQIIGSGEYVDRLRLGLGSKYGDAVTIKTAIDRDQLYTEFYNQIDVLIITSDWETGPLVAFEAMMNQAVVVTSDFKGRAENDSLKDGENCLVFPVGEMTTAALHIQKISSDKNLKNEITSRAYKYSSDYRGLKAMCQSWENLFLSLANEEDEYTNMESTVDFSKLAILSPWQRVKERMKRLLGRRFLHQYASEEWPYFSSSFNRD